MQMRTVGIMLIACSLAGGAAAVQARELREGDKYMCSWGAGTAARAQELKLSGGVAVCGAAEDPIHEIQ